MQNRASGQQGIFVERGISTGPRGGREILQGRSGIYELLRNSEAIQQQVINRAPASVIGQLARSEGMKTLREYGWGRAMAGVTTIEEVLRVTQISEALAEQPVENF